MSRPPPNPTGWLWALGTATVVMAARWREIELHGGEIAQLDQWLVEARQILLPWLDGRLSFTDFFLPHHEHWPVWTRVIVWLEAVAFGEWNMQLQATLNAMLTGVFVGAVAAWLRRSLPLVPAFALTLGAIALWSLPHSWENIVWGFQSHMPLALIFVFVHLHGSFAREPNTTGWWFAQVAGLAALFTLGSMWAAPFAVLLVLVWTTDFSWKKLSAAGLLALSGLVLLLMARAQQPLTGAAAMAATTLPQFIAALLLQLGWPSVWPGAALLVNLPTLFLALRLRGKAQSSPVDRTVLALALWAAAQAAAFALARGSYLGFVSRYGDLLALGVLANSVALWRLLQSSRPWPRVLLVVLALGWGGAVAQGLNFINIQGHTKYFHEHSRQWAQTRIDAVRDYLVAKNIGALSPEARRAVLFPAPEEVARLLDQKKFVALLPAIVRSDPGAAQGHFASAAAHTLREYWTEFTWCGGLLLFAGVLLTWRQPTSTPDAGLPFGDAKSTAITCSVLMLGSGVLLLLWSKPLVFGTEHRWAQYLTPAGSVPDINFHIVTETTYPKDRLLGAASLWPEGFRNLFSGTHVDGPAFMGRVESRAFPLDSPWYVVPFAGFPASIGNALQFQIEDPNGAVVMTLTSAEPNPGTGMTDIGFWAIDVRSYQGKSGRLILTDGRTDAEGWLAVTPPYRTENGPKVAANNRRGWAAESTLSGLRSLQVSSLALGLLAIGSALSIRFGRRQPER